MRASLPVMILVGIGLGCDGGEGPASPAPSNQQTAPAGTTPAPVATNLGNTAVIEDVGVPLTQGSGNKCAIAVDKTPVKVNSDDAIRWVLDVAADAGNCKVKKFKIKDVVEIDCTTKQAISGSTRKALEDCDREIDTPDGGQRRLTCSVVPDNQKRCFKYTIKVHNDELDPEIEIDTGVLPGTLRPPAN